MATVGSSRPPLLRLGGAALLLALTGCSAGDAPTDPGPSVDETFAIDVRPLVGGLSDAEAVDEAKGFCFEVVRGVEKPRDLTIFLKVFVAREVVPAEHALTFLVMAMQTYCPEMERFRPGSRA